MARKADLLGVSGAETIIGAGVKVKGNLASESDIVVDGNLTGDIKTAGSVTIGVNAVVKASVKARDVFISGELTGNVTAMNEVQIQETGRLHGDIACQLLGISTGAVFNGRCQMETPVPPHAAIEPESDETNRD